jgi:hypothetical protein
MLYDNDFPSLLRNSKPFTPYDTNYTTTRRLWQAGTELDQLIISIDYLMVMWYNKIDKSRITLYEEEICIDISEAMEGK